MRQKSHRRAKNERGTIRFEKRKPRYIDFCQDYETHALIQVRAERCFSQKAENLSVQQIREKS